MISIYSLSIKTYSLAKGSSTGFLYSILAELKIHYTRGGESSYKSLDFHTFIAWGFYLLRRLGRSIIKLDYSNNCSGLRTEHMLAILWSDLHFRDSNP